MKFRKLLSALLAGAMIASAMTIGAAADEKLPFTDVPETWYTEAVKVVYNEGIMKGKTDVTFDPTANITRAEVVTAFSRIACTNIEGYGENLTFTDTVSGQWYSDSVGWAAASGIVAGRGDGRFSPADNITRAELASILTKFVNYMEIDLPDNPKLDRFADEGTFDEWMKAPIDAVRRNGLMQGSSGKFNPRGNATRAEIAQVIKNLLPDTGRCSVVLDGTSDYVIVVDKDNAAAVDAAERLQYQLLGTTGAKLEIVDDSAKEQKNEIVIGNVRSSAITTAGLEKGGYEIAVKGSKVYIGSADADGLYIGAVRFAKTAVNGDDARFTIRSAVRAPFEYPVGKITVKGNDISKYTILYPAGASEKTMLGVNDLAKYIEKACGVKVATKQGTSGDYAIIVKEQTLKLSGAISDIDSFSVKTSGNNVVITGSAERGAMYGCYDFLEDIIGWCFMTNDSEYIASKAEITVGDLDYEETSAFEHRAAYNTVYLNDEISPSEDFTYDNDISNRHKLARMKWVDNLHFAHTFQPLTDWAVDQSSQPCLSDEAVYQTMLKNILSFLRADPDAELISVTQNDNVNYCRCDKCMKTYAKYSTSDDPTDGGTSGQMLEFVNRLADEVKKEFPNVYLVTFAYTYTRKAPNGIVPRDNVMVQLCSLECCFSHPLEGTKCNMYFEEDIKAWSAICDNLYIWDYNNNFSYRACPFPNLDYSVLAGNMQLFVKNNARGVFAQGNGVDAGNGEFDELRWYLVAKLMWDPFMSEEEYDAYMCKFMEAYYGDGWKSVYNALKVMDENYDECIGILDDIKTTWMVVKLTSHAESLVNYMEEAMLMAETKAQFEAVERSKIQFDYLYISTVFTKMYNAGGESRETIVALSFALQEAMQKYSITFSSGYPIPELTEITKAPYDWKDLIDEQMFGE